MSQAEFSSSSADPPVYGDEHEYETTHDIHMRPEYPPEENDVPDSPEQQVQFLVVQAQNVRNLNPALQAVYIKHRDLLLDVFNRHIAILQTRSFNISDGQISIFDKVLLELTEYGANLDNAAAITWYCKECFGFCPATDPDRSMSVMEKNLALPVALTQDNADTHNVTGRLHGSLPIRSFQKVPSHAVTQTKNPAVGVGVGVGVDVQVKDDPAFERLWAVYQKAVKDFNLVADQKSFQTQEAARWLRDTTENGIHYLQRCRHPDERLIDEMNVTLRMTQKVVEEFSDGRKRKFDHQVALREQGPGSRRVKSHDVPIHDPVPKYTSSEHVRELFPETMSLRHERHGGRRVRRQTRRGHSGIPYGYNETRMVDSYVPTRDQVFVPRREKGKTRYDG